MKKPAGEDLTRVQIWFQMMKTHRALDRALSAILAPHGLTIPQTEILFMLKKQGCLPQQNLAEGLSVTKGNVAQIIDRLHRAGLLVRTEIADNRRANNLEITEVGMAKLQAVLPHFLEYLKTIFAEFSHQRCENFTADLRDLETASAQI